MIPQMHRAIEVDLHTLLLFEFVSLSVAVIENPASGDTPRPVVTGERALLPARSPRG